MALPRRNCRKVTVNGVQYHWVRGSRGCTVQHASGTGAKLIIDPFGPITYDVVPGAIEFAIEHGWRPTESGPPFWIGYTGILDHAYRFVPRKATDPPFWSDPNRKLATRATDRDKTIE